MSGGSVSKFTSLLFLVLIPVLPSSVFSNPKTGTTSADFISYSEIANNEYSNNEINLTIDVLGNGTGSCIYWFNWTEDIRDVEIIFDCPTTAQNLICEGNMNSTETYTSGYHNRLYLAFSGNESYQSTHISFEWPDCVIFFEDKCYFLGSSYLEIPRDNPYSGPFLTNLEIALPRSARNFDFLVDIQSSRKLNSRFNESHIVFYGRLGGQMQKKERFLPRFSFLLPNIPSNYRLQSYTNDNIRLTYHEVFNTYTNVTCQLANQGYSFLTEQLGTSPLSIPLEVFFVPKQYIRTRTYDWVYAFCHRGKIYLPAEDILDLNENCSNALQTLYHEMTHAFTPKDGPEFFKEGLAELYSIEALKAMGHNESAIDYNNYRLRLAGNFSSKANNQTSLILEWSWRTLINLNDVDDDFRIDYAYAYALYIIQSIYNKSDPDVYRRLFNLLTSENVNFLTGGIPFLSSIDLNIFLYYLELSTNIPLNQIFIDESLSLSTVGFYVQLSLFALIGLTLTASLLLNAIAYGWRMNYGRRKSHVFALIMIVPISFLIIGFGLLLIWMINILTYIALVLLIFASHYLKSKDLKQV